VAQRDADRRTRVPRFVDRVIQRRRADAASAGADEVRSGADRPPAEEDPAAGAQSIPDAERGTGGDHAERIAALERRIEHLEALVEGLQDAVHRETARQESEIGALERKTDAAEMRRSLDRHARERGL
jgi:hypothetical protein